MEVPKGYRRVKVHLKRLESSPLISELDLARKEPKISKYDLIEQNLIDIPELVKKVNEFKSNHINKEHSYSLMPSKEELQSDKKNFQELKEPKKNIKEKRKAYSNDEDFLREMASDSNNAELLNYEWCLCENGDFFLPITRKCQSCQDYFHLKCFYSSTEELKCLFCASSDKSLLQKYKEQIEIRKKFKNEYKNDEPASPSGSNLVDLKIETNNKETKLESQTHDTRKRLNSPSLNTDERLNQRSETIVSRSPKRKLVEPITNQNLKKISKKGVHHDCVKMNSKSAAVANIEDQSESESLADKNLINKSETETCTNKAAKPNSENSFAKSLCNIV